MNELGRKVEAALTPEKFRVWLDAIPNRACAFNARDCEMCALGHYVNSVTDWEPILAVGSEKVFVSEHEERMAITGNPSGFVCELPRWAQRFVAKHDAGRRRFEHAPLGSVYSALAKAEGRQQ